MTARIEGLKKLLRDLRTEDPIYAEPWREALTEATEIVQREAQGRAPSATGKLRGSITTKLQAQPVPRWGAVRANARRGKTRYGFVLNWGQAQRGAGVVTFHSGGQPTKGWFTGALSKLQAHVNGLLDRAARQIEARWGR